MAVASWLPSVSGNGGMNSVPLNSLNANGAEMAFHNSLLWLNNSQQRNLVLLYYLNANGTEMAFQNILQRLNDKYADIHGENHAKSRWSSAASYVLGKVLDALAALVRGGKYIYNAVRGVANSAATGFGIGMYTGGEAGCIYSASVGYYVGVTGGIAGAVTGVAAVAVPFNCLNVNGTEMAFSNYLPWLKNPRQRKSRNGKSRSAMKAARDDDEDIKNDEDAVIPGENHANSPSPADTNANDEPNLEQGSYVRNACALAAATVFGTILGKVWDALDATVRGGMYIYNAVRGGMDIYNAARGVVNSAATGFGIGKYTGGAAGFIYGASVGYYVGVTGAIAGAVTGVAAGVALGATTGALVGTVGCGVTGAAAGGGGVTGAAAGGGGVTGADAGGGGVTGAAAAGGGVTGAAAGGVTGAAAGGGGVTGAAGGGGGGGGVTGAAAAGGGVGGAIGGIAGGLVAGAGVVAIAVKTGVGAATATKAGVGASVKAAVGAALANPYIAVAVIASVVVGGIWYWWNS